MKIIYHHRTLAEDAQGIHVAKMIEAFRELGHQVETVALVPLSGDATDGGRNRIAPWQKVVKKAPQWSYEISTLAYNVTGLWLLERAIRRFKPDFIYERYSLNTVCGILAARRHRLPLILEVNAPLCDEQEALGHLFFRRLAHFTERWICSQATRTIAVTEVLRKTLADKGVPPARLVTLHNGVDPYELNPAVKGDRVRARYDLAGTTVIGFIGWFRPWHGLDMLLEAMDGEEFLKENWRILLVGNGPAMDDLRKLVAAKHMGHMVIFAGPIMREETAEYIAAMDVAVQPSATPYACPMKIIEYMAMARCIVAPRQANILELLDDSSALLFDPGNITSLRKTLEQALSNPQLRQSRGATAYQTLRERGYYWTRNAERVIALLAAQSERASE